jgi:hypothetical protein
MAVLSVVDNLRSGLARNAIICIGEMFKYISKVGPMETELPWVVPKLMRRYCEGGSFISKEVDKSLLMVVHAVSPSKLLPILLTMVKHKHATIRVKASQFLASCLEKVVSFSDSSESKISYSPLQQIGSK